MTLRRSFRPLRPDLDKFLFATVGDKVERGPLSVVSALVQLGLDPWKEADRLSSLSSHEATEQLARLIAELPGRCRPLAEAREIARPLMVLLPKHDNAPSVAPQIQIRPRYLRHAAALTPYWIICAVLTAAALVSAIAHHGFPFGIGGP